MTTQDGGGGGGGAAGGGGGSGGGVAAGPSATTAGAMSATPVMHGTGMQAVATPIPLATAPSAVPTAVASVPMPATLPATTLATTTLPATTLPVTTLPATTLPAATLPATAATAAMAAAPPPPPSSPGLLLREPHIQSAVAFFQNPKVQGSPWQRRVAFLESKGLSSSEILEALKRVYPTAHETRLLVDGVQTGKRIVDVAATVDEWVSKHAPPAHPSSAAVPPLAAVPLVATAAALQTPLPPGYVAVPAATAAASSTPPARDWSTIALAATAALGVGTSAYLLFKDYLPRVRFEFDSEAPAAVSAPHPDANHLLLPSSSSSSSQLAPSSSSTTTLIANDTRLVDSRASVLSTGSSWSSASSSSAPLTATPVDRFRLAALMEGDDTVADADRRNKESMDGKDVDDDDGDVDDDDDDDNRGGKATMTAVRSMGRRMDDQGEQLTLLRDSMNSMRNEMSEVCYMLRAQGQDMKSLLHAVQQSLDAIQRDRADRTRDVQRDVAAIKQAVLGDAAGDANGHGGGSSTMHQQQQPQPSRSQTFSRSSPSARFSSSSSSISSSVSRSSSQPASPSSESSFSDHHSRSPSRWNESSAPPPVPNSGTIPFSSLSSFTPMPVTIAPPSAAAAAAAPTATHSSASNALSPRSPPDAAAFTSSSSSSISAPSATQPPFDAVAHVASATQLLRAAMHTLCSSNAPETVSASLGALTLYISNLLTSHDQARYRKVMTSNTAYQSRVRAVKGAEMVLLGAGFVPKGSSMEWEKDGAPELIDAKLRVLQEAKALVVQAQAAIALGTLSLWSGALVSAQPQPQSQQQALAPSISSTSSTESSLVGAAGAAAAAFIPSFPAVPSQLIEHARSASSSGVVGDGPSSMSVRTADDGSAVSAVSAGTAADGMVDPSAMISAATEAAVAAPAPTPAA